MQKAYILVGTQLKTQEKYITQNTTKHKKTMITTLKTQKTTIIIQPGGVTM